ncbi:MAG: hypothetical protein M3394_01325 [Actinomycetota bacterium]|nr:hypothetical protein [Actinomycetota bacterium]
MGPILYYPVYVNGDVPGAVYTGNTVQACVNYGTVAGLFFTPSETKVTTDGSATTVQVAGGVCVMPGLVAWGHECVRNPSFTVEASARNYNDRWAGNGTILGASVTPCVDTTNPYGVAGHTGTTLGAACARVGSGGDVGFNPSRQPNLFVVPGFCVRTKVLSTCMHATSYTRADLVSGSQEACATVGDGVLCRGAVVVCTTEVVAGEVPAPKADCDVVPTS